MSDTSSTAVYTYRLVRRFAWFPRVVSRPRTIAGQTIKTVFFQHYLSLQANNGDGHWFECMPLVDGLSKNFWQTWLEEGRISKSDNPYQQAFDEFDWNSQPATFAEGLRTFSVIVWEALRSAATDHEFQQELKGHFWVGVNTIKGYTACVPFWFVTFLVGMMMGSSSFVWLTLIQATFSLFLASVVVLIALLGVAACLVGVGFYVKEEKT